MKYKKYPIGPYNIHVIRTDRFKSINVQVNFRRPILKEEVTIRNVLTRMLLQSTKNYPTNRLLMIECEKLYGIKIWNENTRIGNYSNMSFSMKVLNDKYTEEGNFEEAIKLLIEILFNPNQKDNKFDNKSFEMVKASTLADIKSIKDNMTKYSLIRLLEEMDNESPISYISYGYLEDLEKIDVENLYQYYESVVQSDFVDIFVLGDVDPLKIKKLITEYFKVNTIKRVKEPILIEHEKVRRRIKKRYEEEMISQSKLSISCKLNKLTDFERRYAFGLYSLILGGPGGSKLFESVREKNSLAYYVSAQPMVIDNLLLIYSGINKKDFPKALKLIRKELDNMKKGNFTDQDLERMKKTTISSLEAIEDSTKRIIDIYYSMELLGSDDLEDKKKKVLKVTREDIISVAKKVYPDTVFLLEGGLNDERDEN